LRKDRRKRKEKEEKKKGRETPIFSKTQKLYPTCPTHSLPSLWLQIMPRYTQIPT
jgi:hypothetical protein